MFGILWVSTNWCWTVCTKGSHKLHRDHNLSLQLMLNRSFWFVFFGKRALEGYSTIHILVNTKICDIEVQLQTTWRAEFIDFIFENIQYPMEVKMSPFKSISSIFSRWTWGLLKLTHPHSHPVNISCSKFCLNERWEVKCEIEHNYFNWNLFTISVITGPVSKRKPQHHSLNDCVADIKMFSHLKVYLEIFCNKVFQGDHLWPLSW